MTSSHMSASSVRSSSSLALRARPCAMSLVVALIWLTITTAVVPGDASLLTQKVQAQYPTPRAPQQINVYHTALKHPSFRWLYSDVLSGLQYKCPSTALHLKSAEDLLSATDEQLRGSLLVIGNPMSDHASLRHRLAELAASGLTSHMGVFHITDEHCSQQVGWYKDFAFVYRHYKCQSDTSDTSYLWRNHTSTNSEAKESDTDMLQALANCSPDGQGAAAGPGACSVLSDEAHQVSHNICHNQQSSTATTESTKGSPAIPILWWPVGYNNYFISQYSIQLRPLTGRPWLWSFAGDLLGKPERVAFKEAVDGHPEVLQLGKLHTYSGFGGHGNRYDALDGWAYSQLMQDTVFVPSPTGCGESLRMWEALEAGAIPVLLDMPQYSFTTELGLPVPKLASWDAFPEWLLEQHQQGLGAWEGVQRQLVQRYNEIKSKLRADVAERVCRLVEGQE